MLREGRAGRDLGDADPAVEVVGQRRQQVAIPAEQVLDVGEVVQHRSADDHALLTDRMAAEGEGGDHAEVAAATAQRPEQIGVGLRAGGDEAAVGEHDVGGDQVVHGQAEAPGEVADAAAEGQAADTGGGDEAGRRGHAERAGRVVDVAPGASAVDPDRAGRRVDRGAAQPAEVDDEGAVPDAEPAAMMTAAADGEGQHVSRAYRTQASTSATSAHRTTASGCRSTAPL